jgi:hypothetical protein
MTNSREEAREEELLERFGLLFGVLIADCWASFCGCGRDGGSGTFEEERSEVCERKPPFVKV